MASPIHPIVLCGGSGARLWPLSRADFSKQYVPISDGRSLLDMTLRRLGGFGQPLMLVASHACRFLALSALRQSGLPGQLLLEEAPKSTATAMVLAALAGYQSDDVLLFTPSDHLIPDHAVFEARIRDGLAAAEAGSIVTLGIRPTWPNPAYGYIQCGADRGDGSHEVTGFIEKPAPEMAARLILNGQVFWNSGVFLCRVDALLAAVSDHAPDILESAKQAMRRVTTDTQWPFVRPDAQALTTSRVISFDHAVMEHHQRAVVVPFLAQWSDVGSWDAFAELHPANDEGNRTEGRAIVVESRNTFVKADRRLVVAIGTQDLVVVETADAVLVMHASKSQQIKQVVEVLEQQGHRETESSPRVIRPWGWYEELDRGNDYRVKRLHVEPGCSLSLQMHQFRAEHWVVLTGQAHVVRGHEEFVLNPGESTDIGCGQIHQLNNLSDQWLQVLEVQTGSYLEEDDIVRFDPGSVPEVDGSPSPSRPSQKPAHVHV
jgi:mannose-1-phosphate guanylyltransferase/mannose-6-phosphate isomerase